MITYLFGNIFDSKAEALVNPVNTVGVMEKGLALSFKELFPKNYELYLDACRENKIRIGKMFITRTDGQAPYLIINFPTKRQLDAINNSFKKDAFIKSIYLET